MKQRWATLDCYGTLIDWDRGVVDAFAGLWPKADPDALLRRLHEIEPKIQHGSDKAYRDVLADVLHTVADAEGLKLDDEEALARSLPEWPPFVEAPDELRELKKRGWRLAILSNTDPDLLDASIRRLDMDVDLRITVAEAGSYKPAHGHWDRFFEVTDADRAGHAHVAASLFHDIAPATELGLRCVWINRSDEATDLQPSVELATLEGLADTLDALVVS